MLVVTELPERVQILARGLIRKRTENSSTAGFCRCCIWREVLEDKVDAESLQQLRSSSPPSIAANSNNLTTEAGIDVAGTSSACVCTRCGASSLVRRANRRTMSGQTVYMVEREAYLFLLFLDSTHNLQPTDEFWDDIMMDSIRMSKLIKSIHESFQPWMIWPEISSRQCTHDEDRVLGILGLLGFRGDMQLRTGQTLEQQLVHVANSCDPDVMIKVCTVDPRGGPAAGLSWAPNFRDPYAYFGVSGCGLHARAARRCFGHEPFHNIDPEGSLQLLCCPQLKPGKDILQQVLDLRQVEFSLANVDERIKNLGDSERHVEIVKVTEDGMVLKGKAALGGVKPCWREDGSAGKKKAMIGGLRSLSEEDESEVYEEFRGWRNAGGAIELPKEHSPTHCLHFEDGGVILPLIWSLNSQWKTLGWPDAEHFVSYFPELTMALASHPWNPIYLQLLHNEAAVEALPWPVLHRLEDQAIQIEMELWAVLLGSVANGNYHVAMMCMARPSTRKNVQLHKVGMFFFPIEVSDQIFSQHLPTTCFEIGGFGPDLSEFVTLKLTNTAL
ncbi:hypothetical protein GOP47_0005807 [Adiantum capillus-veneris]|uniref:Uncharacterized protein n=1 Tax=Adiantum capillus-veneris TaxID=13818 RepID=A0A9D4V6Z3_ADICA|nr:hypothetical protein GOP47_0005807 [Adiantum capillus-veneris]